MAKWKRKPWWRPWHWSRLPPPPGPASWERRPAGKMPWGQWVGWSWPIGRVLEVHIVSIPNEWLEDGCFYRQELEDLGYVVVVDAPDDEADYHFGVGSEHEFEAFLCRGDHPNDYLGYD